MKKFFLILLLSFISFWQCFSYDILSSNYSSELILTNYWSDTPRNIDFNTDGSKMYLLYAYWADPVSRIYEYNLSTPFDITTASLLNNFWLWYYPTYYRNFSITKNWLTFVYEKNWNLYYRSFWTAWDISTLWSENFLLSTWISTIYGINFDDTWDNLFFMNNNWTIYQYSLDIQNDVTNLTYIWSKFFISATSWFDIISNNIFLSKTDENIYHFTYTDDITDSINTTNIYNVWIYENPYAINFSNDWSKFYTINYNYSSISEWLIEFYTNNILWPVDSTINDVWTLEIISWNFYHQDLDVNFDWIVWYTFVKLTPDWDYIDDFFVSNDFLSTDDYYFEYDFNDYDIDFFEWWYNYSVVMVYFEWDNLYDWDYYVDTLEDMFYFNDYIIDDWNYTFYNDYSWFDLDNVNLTNTWTLSLQIEELNWATTSFTWVVLSPWINWTLNYLFEFDSNVYYYIIYQVEFENLEVDYSTVIQVYNWLITVDWSWFDYWGYDMSFTWATSLTSLDCPVDVSAFWSFWIDVPLYWRFEPLKNWNCLLSVLWSWAKPVEYWNFDPYALKWGNALVTDNFWNDWAELNWVNRKYWDFVALLCFCVFVLGMSKIVLNK